MFFADTLLASSFPDENHHIKVESKVSKHYLWLRKQLEKIFISC